MIKNLQLNNGWMYLPFKMLGEVRFVLSIYEQLMIKKKQLLWEIKLLESFKEN